MEKTKLEKIQDNIERALHILSENLIHPHQLVHSAAEFITLVVDETKNLHRSTVHMPVGYQDVKPTQKSFEQPETQGENNGVTSLQSCIPRSPTQVRPGVH